MIDNLTVKLKKFKKISKIIIEKEMKEISFEFLVGSCFPKVMDNIKEEMRRQYTLGFIEGKKEAENEE